MTLFTRDAASVGNEWLVDAEGCRPEALSDLLVMRRLLDRVVVDLGLAVVGEPHWHAFPFPGGVTGLYLLTESHLACHTYPEIGIATFNLYACRARPGWAWEAELPRAIGARRVRVTVIPRAPRNGACDTSRGKTEERT